MTNHTHADATAGAVARDALDALPVRLRTPYVMRRMAAASDADISDALGVYRPLVSRRVTQAERRLREAFIRAGISARAGDAALGAYLAVPLASHFVPRVMDAISSLRRPSQGAAQRTPAPGPVWVEPVWVEPVWVEKATRVLVATALSGALVHASWIVALAARARWRG
jgi:hypothetical protein